MNARMNQPGAPSLACTPDKFPGLMAAAIKKQDIALLAVNENLVTTRGQGA